MNRSRALAVLGVSAWLLVGAAHAPAQEPARPSPGVVLRGHENPVVRVVFTPDGSCVISASNGDHHEVKGRQRVRVPGTDNTIRVWRAGDGVELRKFELTHKSHFGVQGLCLSPDGKSLAAATSWIWANGDSEPTVHVWEISTGDRKHLFAAPGASAMRAVGFSDDGDKVVAVRSGPGGVLTWSRSDLKSFSRVNLEGNKGGVESPRLTVSAGSKFVLGGAPDTPGDFRLWDAATGGVVRTFRGHTRPVAEAVMSPDGARVLSCAEDATVRVWETATGRELVRLDSPPGNVASVAFAPDGKQFLAGAETGTVTLHDAGTGRVGARLVGHAGKVNTVAFSPDGRLAASGGDDHSVRVWNLGHPLSAAGEIALGQGAGATRAGAPGANPPGHIGQPKLVVPLGHTGPIRAVAFSPDGRQAATASDDHTSRLWDLDSGAEVRTLLGHAGPVVCVAYSPDGKVVVTGGDDGSVRFWEVASGKQSRSLSVGTGVRSLALTPDGKHVLTGSESGAVLRDSHSGRAVRTFVKGIEGACVAVSRDGSRVLTGGVGRTATVRLWDMGGTEIRPLAKAGQIASAAFSPDGDHVLTDGGLDGNVHMWDARTGKHLRTFGVQLENQGRALAFSPDGKRVLTGTRGGAQVWDAATGDRLETVRWDTGSLVHGVAFSPDGKQILTGGSDARARLWHVEAVSRPVSFQGHGDRVFSVAVSADGGRVLTGSFDKTARLWDTGTGKVLHTLEGSDWVVTAALSRDGKRALVGGRDKVVQLWDADTGEVLRRFEGHTSPITCAVFSADGRVALTGSFDRSARLWDAGTGRVVRTFPEGKGFVSCVALSPDGRQVLTGSHKSDEPFGGAVRLWDAASGREVRSFPINRSNAMAVAFSPDGMRLLAVNEDHTVRAWDAATGKEAHAFKIEGALIKAAAFSADGRQLVTGGWDGFVQRWDMSGKELAKLPGHKGEVGAIAISGDGRVVASGGLDRTARAFSTAGPPAVIHTLQGTAAEVGSAVFSPDGKHIVVQLGEDPLKQAVRLWDVAAGKDSRAFQHPTGHNRLMVFSPDGRLAVTAGSDDTTRVWDTAAEKEAYTAGPAVESAVFSPDGKQLVLYGKGSFKILAAAEGKVVRTFAGYAGEVAFSADGKRVFGLSGNKLLAWDASDGTPAREFGSGPGLYRSPNGTFTLKNPRYALSPDGNLHLSADDDGVARLRTPPRPAGTEKVVREFRGHAGPVKSVAFSPDGKRVLTAGKDRTVRLWDAAAGTEVCRLINFHDGSGIFVTPDNYYMAVGRGERNVSFSTGNQSFPFEQFDLKYNRPDRVLERLAPGARELSAAYRQAYLKRLRLLNISEADLGDDPHVPEVSVETATKFATREKTVRLTISARDTKYLLDRVRVYVNGVPMNGTAGIPLRGRAVKEWVQEVEVELSAGRNRIDVSVLNEKGAASLGQSHSVRCDAPAGKSDLYVVAVGVSDYRDARYRLSYADKDAGDLVSLLEGRRGRFGDVKVLRLLNRDVTRENVVAAAKFLEPCRVDDTVVLFFAGHGLLDSDLNYLFATADVDFADPGRRGLPYEALERLLDGTRARRKLLLMDTCHSGELDKEDVRAAAKADGGEVKTRTFRGGLTPEIRPKVGLENSYQLARRTFANLHRGTGAVVIGSAGGAEYALESASWRNGVFTYALLRGLRGEADRNGDGLVLVSELREFVEGEVRRLTGGRQTPAARGENLLFDFSLE